MAGQVDVRIIGVGELLWDLFPDGPRLGGAPFNVIANLRRLGHRVAFVTAIGDDRLGRAALAAADDLGVDATFISTALDLPTGTVEVTPDPVEGHRFAIRSPAAYESIGDGDALVARIRTWGPGALVYGTLAQRSDGVRELTRRIASEVRPAYRLYDVNLREGCWTPSLVIDLLGDATIVKVNEHESETLADLLATSADPRALGTRLAERFGVAVVCITRGAGGASLWAAGTERSVAGMRVGVRDTVGAGDAFAAALIHGLVSGMPPGDALELANRLGALVASRAGALPPWRLDELA
ncbi:MAG TPA: PfkB family carbohydrate kinase [Marmoricola sp.]|nr:PfkB family carbohydrate kinase [Marmoricola sp.]